MGFKIIIKGPDRKLREIVLAEGETYVGRDPANTLVLDGRGVSRRHARLVASSSQLTVIDLGSTYGTRVNEAVVMQRDLVDGDTVTIGMHYLVVKKIGAERARQLAAVAGPAHFPEDVTEAPPPSDVHKRKTIQMNRNAIEFILDNPDTEGRAVKVLPKHDSSLMKAVQRLGAAADFRESPSYDTLPSPGTKRDPDYQALLLMYKVSELLAAATDLDSFVDPMADLVLQEVQADTVVLLMLDQEGELIPQVIRHRGELKTGEVPVSRAIIDRVMTEQIAVMSNDASQDARIKPGQSVALYNIKGVMAFPLLVRGALMGILYLSRSLAKPFKAADGDLVAALASLVVSGIESAQLKEQIIQEMHQRKTLERFHPPEVVDQIFKSGVGESSLQEHRATVLICDLEGFDTLVGKVEPMRLASVLHDYYEMLYEKIFANGGSLVRLHDGWAMALFGIAQSQDRDAVWAVESARTLCGEFDSLAALWPSQSLHLRCALDSGQVVAGIVGSLERPEYTAIGPPISAASVLLRQPEGETSVLFTERTWADLPQQRYLVEPLPQVLDVPVYRLKI